MSIGRGRSSVTLEEILQKTTELEILSYYLGISSIPVVIQSPLREDKKPSFGLYTKDGKRIYYVDFSTGERGGLFDLLSKMWGLEYLKVLERIQKDLTKFKTSTTVEYVIHNNSPVINKSKRRILQCKVRQWKDYDLEYWNSYGISLKWLKFAEIYPISHKIVTKDGYQYIFNADKYAYAFIERKESKISIKIYQPFNVKYKWDTSTDESVWSLWTKIPKTGDNLIISSSLKDCLNLWANTGIPAICMQGEGYIPKPKIIEDLKSRYKNIIVFYDNDFTNKDNPGRKDSIKLCNQYNLKRIEIPSEYEAKDPSDLYKKYGKDKYLEVINNILKTVII